MENVSYKRWLVGLDMTSMDETIIKWVNYLADILKPEVIYFVHTEKDFDIPDYLPVDLKSSVMTIDEKQEKIIRKNVSDHFTSNVNRVEVEVIEGKPFETLLHWAKVKKIDLFVSGKKHKKNGSGILPHKLSRRLACSVLFVPDLEVEKIKKILIPIDFSDHSTRALQTALLFSEKNEGTEIFCYHIYDVPTGYYKTGKSYEEFAQLIKDNAEIEFKKFSRPFDHPLTFSSNLLKGGTADELILDQAKFVDANLIIMGSRGQTSGAVILLGSTAEEVIKGNESNPLLIVKKEDEHISFFEALGKI